MNFAKDLMKKYGWEEGKGLGKNEKGIVKPLKANLKFDTSGFGLDKAEEFNNHWWERVFNDAAKNIDIKKDQENVTIETKDNEAVEISTKDYSIKKLRKLKGTQKHDNFLRSSILSGPGNDKELPNKIDTDDVKFTTQYKILTDDELFAACGGRTAHKGARHGIIMKGKLQRIEEQEKELLAKMSAGKNNLDIEMKNVKSNNNDDYDWKLVKNKKNKRKLKSDCDNNDIGIKHHQQDQHETDELNDILYTTEYSNKKSKKKKREEKKIENELVDAMNTVGSITKLSDNVKKNKQNIKIDQEESRKIRMGTQDDAININNYNHHHRTNEVYRKKSKKLKNNGISKCEQYKEKKKLKKSLKKIHNEMEETLAII